MSEAGDLAGDGDAALLTDVAVVLSGIRKAKSEAKVSMRTDVTQTRITGSADVLARVSAASGDLSAAGRLLELTMTTADSPLAVSVTL